MSIAGLRKIHSVLAAAALSLQVLALAPCAREGNAEAPGCEVEEDMPEPASLLQSKQKAYYHPAESHFVFLEVYAVRGSSAEEEEKEDEDLGRNHTFEIYHSKFLICPRWAFSSKEQRELMQGLGNAPYKYLEDSWWESRHKPCAMLAYLGNMFKSEPCSGLHLREQLLSTRFSFVRSFNPDRVWKYFYGVGGVTAEGLRGLVCQGGCAANWAGASYNALSNNCNTFTATGMECVLNLSGRLPHLGLSTGWGPKCSICP